MGEEKERTKSGVYALRWLIFIIGNAVMAFGIVLMIVASLGNAPWDVLHIGLQLQFGLTIGLWAIIVGTVIIAVTCLLTKAWPKIGSVVNMLLIGMLIDVYMLIPWLTTPEHWFWKLVMLLAGIVVMGYGMGIYISARFGAGPRDGLMLAIVQLTGWKIQWVRSVMEVSVLLIGWLMGGPVFIGTLLFALLIGHVVALALSQCERWVDRWIGGVSFENLNKRPVRVNHHDGVSQ